MSYGETADGRATTFAETREYATIAERSGLDSIWVFDHLLFRFPPEPDEGPHEAWTTLSALAPVVPRVELGSVVMCSSFRPAGLMAKMTATLDDLSGGRLILGGPAHPPLERQPQSRVLGRVPAGAEAEDEPPAGQ